MRFWPLALLLALTSCTSSLTPLGQFDITLRYNGTFTTTQKAAIESAVARWKTIINLGLSPAVEIDVKAGECYKDFPAYTGAVKSILVDVGVANLGGGGTLAISDPCLIDSSRSLTRYGTMVFDSNQLINLEKKNLLVTTAVHELGHVLGFGTLWDINDRHLIQGAGSDTTCGADPRFIGSNAEREWHAMAGTGDVPVENVGGKGTCDGHWRDAVFKNEIMTGFVDTGPNPLSRLTIAAMQDLGYGVNYAAADVYSLSMSGQDAANTGEKLEEQLIRPHGVTP